MKFPEDIHYPSSLEHMSSQIRWTTKSNIGSCVLTRPFTTTQDSSAVPQQDMVGGSVLIFCYQGSSNT